MNLKNRFFKLKRDLNRWSLLLLLVLGIVSIPILTIGFKLFGGPGESWNHIVDYVLFDYLKNSFLLALFCSIIVILFGVTTAWLVSRFEFPFRKQLEWLLILPLSVPAYIMAYAYAGVFGYSGIFSKFMGFIGIGDFRIEIMNIYGLSLILSISLFPYVYVSSRTFFLAQATNLLEASRMLGISEFKSFFKLIFPLARPAIIAGLVLVLMEVLNDYGAASYYGVSTFTTGIFRSWFSLGEPETAIYLSAILLLIVFGLILFEKWQRRHLKFTSAKTSKQNYNSRIKPRKVNQMWFSIICFIPVFLGFILPVIQLFIWLKQTFSTVWTAEFISITLESFGIAFLTASVTVFVALLLLFFTKWNKIRLLKISSKLGVLGYAIPGIIIAIGVLIPSLYLDKWLIEKNITSKLILNATLIALVYAYVVRFLAVAYQPLESSSLKIDRSLSDSSKVLGQGNFKTFFKIEFPLIRVGLLSAFILVFIDILKELPLTLIMKPYDVNTLAVKAFEYASDEMVSSAALPSLLIILTALIPAIFLNKLLLKNASNS
ncbi:ABC transporter permease [Psychroflexus sediminis]|uniref:Iron(III) transport system permease protein n=1 Tax=Psychroflexus sediminis TaxID=470826 RepID=A0A1G7YAA3_9FLAO|nr:iron ABC transporter permease [Psychroflexus sediminis]SDG93412.1 iron(III) transport system permease protein [Psychroflexus sediminis]